MIGSESVSAFLKSSSKDLDSALLALASPNWPTKTAGFWLGDAVDRVDDRRDRLLGLLLVARGP